MTHSADGDEIGRGMRRQVPRTTHAEWTAPADRPQVADFLQETDRGRLAELLHLRYERMAESPFGFFRGASGYLGRGDAMDCAIMRFGVAYAGQTERDHAAFVAATNVGG